MAMTGCMALWMQSDRAASRQRASAANAGTSFVLTPIAAGSRSGSTAGNAFSYSMQGGAPVEQPSLHREGYRRGSSRGHHDGTSVLPARAPARETPPSDGGFARPRSRSSRVSAGPGPIWATGLSGTWARGPTSRRHRPLRLPSCSPQGVRSPSLVPVVREMGSRPARWARPLGGGSSYLMWVRVTFPKLMPTSQPSPLPARPRVMSPLVTTVAAPDLTTPAFASAET
jgi:hypothetical protein